jgi:predicted acetyltransferase
VIVVPELVRPTVRVHASYLAAIAEYQAEGGYPDFDGLSVGRPTDFRTYVEQLCRDPRTAPARDWPAMTLLWWIDGREYLGRLSIWHALTGPSAESGHIGYDIRPRERGKGHATAMLTAALPIAAELGIDPAVATVRIGNLASQHVLEAAGARMVMADERRLYFNLPTGRRTAD